jgi:hypothetical protein
MAAPSNAPVWTTDLINALLQHVTFRVRPGGGRRLPNITVPADFKRVADGVSFFGRLQRTALIKIATLSSRRRKPKNAKFLRLTSKNFSELNE